MYELLRISDHHFQWFKNKLCHRKNDKPALFTCNSFFWYKKGKMHRDDDRPACVFQIHNIKNEIHSFYKNGVRYDIKENDFSKEYYNSRGKLSSIKGKPSVIYKNGTKEWRLNGCLHRIKLPAVEYANGDKEWWVCGKRHRSDGPAVVIGNKQFWFEHGVFQK